MATEKTASDNTSDFLDGVYNTYIAVPLAFGDFLARISGYRDFQVNSNSVVPSLDTYTYQQQTFDELRMIVKAMWYEESRNPIIDAFITDVQKRPFYYIGSFGMASIVKATFPSKALKIHYSILFPIANVDQKVHALFEQARNWIARSDPLVLDLDGDGIETVGVNATTHILFDHNNDGITTGTGWVKGEDGLLVLDRNGNGVIDNGSELFGDSTTVNGVNATDGFSALRAEDTNKNGTFDAGDTNFTNVEVWQDKNQDGISQTNELHTLSELGIKSINLASTATSGWLEGATQTATGTFTRTNGTKGEVGNLNFASNAFYREYLTPLTLTDTAKGLPDMQGSGAVRDLQEASTLSSALTNTLQTLSTTYETKAQMMAQVDTLLAQWASTSSMATSINNASSIGKVTLFYALPFTTISDSDLYNRIHNIATNTSITAADTKRYNELLAQQTRIGNIIGILERFNGESFLSITPPPPPTVTTFSNTGTTTTREVGIVTGGGASMMLSSGQGYALSQTQVDALEQSYTALKQSVYDNLVLQTRLSRYTDALRFSVDPTTGLKLDATAMMTLLSTYAKTDPTHALEDLIELRKYAGENLGALGWNSDNATDGFYLSRHPELVSGSKREMPNRVRHDGNAVNNFNPKIKTKAVA